MIVVWHPSLGACLGAAVGRPRGARALRLVWSSECVDGGLAGVASVQEFADVVEATAFLLRGGVDYAAAGCTAIAVRDGDLRGRRTPLTDCAAVAGNGTVRLTTLVVER